MIIQNTVKHMLYFVLYQVFVLLYRQHLLIADGLKVSELFNAVLCTRIVYSYKHTYMISSYCSAGTWWFRSLGFLYKFLQLY